MSAESLLNGRVTLHCGDCLEVMDGLAENSLDSCVCDPPYHLTSIVKRFGAKNAAAAKEGSDGAFRRASAGFMGRQWDGGDIAFQVSTWAKVFRVLKPGAFIVAFSSSRTFGRMSVAIEDAGFINHPLTGWIFGQGFPKAHRVHAPGWEGFRYGTQATKPALEPIYIGQKPFSEKTGTANVLRWGTGALNIDGCRVSTDDVAEVGKPSWGGPMKRLSGAPGQEGKLVPRTPPHNNGRWPANVMTDGSPEVFAAFPDSDGQLGDVSLEAPSAKTGNVYGKMNRHGEKSADARYNDRGSTNFAALPGMRRNDSGSAARFFWSSKAGANDRLGSKHPTVKPVDLIQELARLYTPPGGTILDPFAGTGTTGEAAFREGFNAILIEREPEYQADIRRRMALCLAGPDERRRESIKAKIGTGPIEAGPLFANTEAAE